MNDIYINGPVNVARLEGTINNTKKVIYLFFDLHYTISDQSKCNNPNSIDLHHFIRDFIKSYKGNNIYDIIFEKRIGDLSSDDIMKKGYIREFLELFNSAEQYEKFRFHYGDVRDVMSFSNMTSFILIRNTYSKNELIALKNGIEIIKTALGTHYDILTGSDQYKNTEEYYLYNKMVNINDDDIVKTKITSLLKNITKHYTEVISIATKIIDTINEYISLLQSHSRKKIIVKNTNLDCDIVQYGIYGRYELDNLLQFQIDNTMLQECTYFKTLFDRLGVTWTDIYSLRRISKKYTKNIILYMGASHCTNIIHMLVNKFNFNITHIYKNPEHIKDLTNFLKNNEPLNIFTEHKLKTTFDYFHNTQCVNLNNFPKKFE